jgi:hypothetical protein
MKQGSLISFFWTGFITERAEFGSIPGKLSFPPRCSRSRNLILQFAAIRRELEVGGNLSPWLSDRVRRKPQNPRADLMFNDWQIAHFHLGSLVF